ncbi:MAG: FG-GAP repeat protein [Acidobacteriales bacterium]|nr:FG-GAP repeat protein [Terriglobales bacterium]
MGSDPAIDLGAYLNEVFSVGDFNGDGFPDLAGPISGTTRIWSIS